MQSAYAKVDVLADGKATVALCTKSPGWRWGQPSAALAGMTMAASLSSSLFSHGGGVMDQQPTDLARFRAARRFLAAKEAVQRSPAESDLKIIAEALRTDEPDRPTSWPTNRGNNVVPFRGRDGRE